MADYRLFYKLGYTDLNNSKNVYAKKMLAGRPRIPYRG